MIASDSSWALDLFDNYYRNSEILDGVKNICRNLKSLLTDNVVFMISLDDEGEGSLKNKDIVTICFASSPGLVFQTAKTICQ